MIEINWTILIQMLNFIVLIFVLNQFLYKPILKILAEREKKISDGQLEIKNFNDKGKALIDNYNESIHKAKIDAVTEKNIQKKKSSEEANVIIEESKKQADQIITQITGELSQQVDRARKELEPEVSVLAADITERVLGRKVA